MQILFCNVFIGHKQPIQTKKPFLESTPGRRVHPLRPLLHVPPADPRLRRGLEPSRADGHLHLRAGGGGSGGGDEGQGRKGEGDQVRRH